MRGVRRIPHREDWEPPIRKVEPPQAEDEDPEEDDDA